MTVIKPQQTGADPASADNRKVVLLIQLLTNVDESAPTCASTMTGDEEWTVSVPSPRIQGVALQSLDREVGGPCPQTLYRPVPANDGPFATVTEPAPEFTSGRTGLDAVLVLDRSGSMSSTDGGATSRLDKLKTATNQFVAMWNTLRNTESITGAIQSPEDHIGVVFFDDSLQWLTSGVGSKLVPFTGSTPATLSAALNPVTLGGATSIGDGLEAATGADALPASGGPNRRVVLLMTDGAQNTPRFAFADGGQIKTSDDAGNITNPTPLPKQPFQLYSVTVGNEFGPDAPINQALANITGGYSLNTTHPAAELDAFFLQALQNFHKFSTVETMRVIQDKTLYTAPFQTTFPVTSSTTRLAFNLTPQPGQQGGVRLELTPPGGGAPMIFVAPTWNTSGAISDGFRLPLPGGNNGFGEWKMRVLSNNDGKNPVPFNFVLLGDDVTLNSSLGAANAEYAVGGKIKLTAQINDFGKTLKGLNSQAGAIVKAIVVSPGNNVGDVLSDSAAQPSPSPAGDNGTAAQNKLAAILSADAGALKQNQNEVILRDDGSPASGDDKANDGIYTASVPAEFEGHYNFVFLVQGKSDSGGQFVRQQIRTVHVRSLPDPAKTQYTSNIVTIDGGKAVVIVATPKNVLGGKMGPGWANYFWFNVQGQAPVKPKDNLDGTYTVQIPFTGDPPKVSLHFLPEPIYRPDGFVPPAGTLTSGNSIGDDIIGNGPAGPGQPWWKRWWWLILIVLLLLFLLRRK
ncbi:vWA domain-containing protein [Lysobacter capsici]|uniref:vWA domain-containing protein n=1 Tax=Lysobacter capsici TaxID=435897 RepID=UPI001C00311D|nr:VWA domain-containing protein [Lysobacter capsici]QWF19483.1 VWA domain-containing protein [Lysobacter capsici]